LSFNKMLYICGSYPNNIMDYLKLPLDLPSALEGDLERCSYEESIAQHIMLLVVSRYGEMESKDDYGSMIWNLDKEL